MSRIPIIKLRDNEKIWMQHIYDNFFNNRIISYRELRAQLNAELPKNFDTSLINQHLLTYNGERPSLLGVIAVEGNDKILDECTRIVLAIKDILIATPRIEAITSEEIAIRTGMERTRVQLLLTLITYYGSFFSSGSMTENGIGFDTLRLDKDDNIFNFYMSFQDMRQLLDKYFKEEEERDEIIKLKLQKEDALLGLSGNNSTNLQALTDRPNPYFRARNITINHHRCFVIMPFTQSWSTPVYVDCIRPAIESLGLSCVRADNLSGPIIIEDIWTEINRAAFLVADVTGQNSNVMYEIGIAHALGKPMILITQELDKIPFDFLHYRHLPYVNAITGNSFFDKEFKGSIRELYGREYPEIAKTLIG